MDRLKSLDFFRGVTVAGMIMVNNPGTWSAVYPPLRHADWHGCTPTDLVFPFFLFIMGVSIPYAMGTKKLDPANHPALIGKIVKRTLTLIFLGLFLAAFPYFELGNLRFPGVLQRIGLVFFCCAMIFLKTNSWRTQAGLGAAFLLIYWILMAVVPVPGFGPANLEKDTNLGAWLDRLLMDGHLWSASKTWDPEGLLSTLPAVGTGLIGMLAGQWLKAKQEVHEKLVGIFVAANLLVFIGLCWDLAFPINKQLWTSSYVLYTGGLGLNVLGVCYYFIDVKKVQTGVMPFVMFGMNPIAAYFASGIVADTIGTIQIGEESLKSWIFNTIFVPVFPDPMMASLVAALVGVFLFYIPVWILYKKNIFVKV